MPINNIEKKRILDFKSKKVDINYQDYKKLIFKSASKWYKWLGIDFQDAVSLGNIAFCLSLRTYDESRGSFCTHLYLKLENRYKKYYGDLKKRKIETLSYDDKNNLGFIENMSYNDIEYLLQSISNDARQVIQLVLKSPVKLLEMSKKLNKKAIKKFLYIEFNWNPLKIDSVFAEIANAL